MKRLIGILLATALPLFGQAPTGTNKPLSVDGNGNVLPVTVNGNSLKYNGQPLGGTSLSGGTAGHVITASGATTIQDSGTALSSLLSSVPISRTIFVDVNGNDTTAAAGDASKPCLTIGNKAVALATALAPTAANPVVIQVGPGTFTENSGIVLPSYVALVGAGMDVTTINSSLPYSTNPIVRIGAANTVIADMTINGTLSGTAQSPIGTKFFGVTGAKFFRVKTFSDSDGLLIALGGSSTTTDPALRAYGCIFTSNYDATNLSGGYAEFYDCTLIAHGPSVYTTGPSIAAGLCTLSTKVKFFSGYISADGASGAGSYNTAIEMRSAVSQTITITNTIVRTGSSASANYDLYSDSQGGSGDTINYANVTREDGAALAVHGPALDISRYAVRDNNLSDLTNFASARTNIGLGNGTSNGQIPIWDNSQSKFIPGDPLVQGLVAEGAAIPNPIVIGGKDGSGNNKALILDSAGRATVNINGTVTTTPPSNASTNVSQINGVTPLMGAGNGGTGSLRVNIASDQVAIPVSQNGAPWSMSISGTPAVTIAQSNITADYDSGAGTQNLTMFGIALPANGGAVAGGTSSNPIRVDPTGSTTQPVSGTVTANAGSGTFNIQSNASVNETQVGGTTIDTNSGNKSAGTQRFVLATDQPQLTNALKVDPSGVTSPVSGTVTANAGTGNFNVVGTKTNNNAAPGATNVGALVGIANAAAPTYTEGDEVLLSTDLAGNVRVTGSLSVGGTTDNSAFTAGTSTGTPTLGFYHSTVDSVTDGRSAALAIDSKRNLFTVIRDAADNARGANVTASNALVVDGSAVTQPVSGTFWQATQPVSLASLPALAAGSNTIGNVDLQDSAGNGITSNSTTTTSKRGLDINILSILGTAPSAAGKLDIKGADGDIFVRQTTGSNLHTNVDSLPALPTGSNVIGHVIADSGSTTAVTQATASSLQAQVAQKASVSTSGTLQNAVTASGNGSTLSTDGMSSAVLTVNCSSCSGGTTVNFEGSEDGTNYASLTATQIGTTTEATSTTTSGLTYWQIPVAGLQNIRARVSGYSAGTITVTGHTVPVDWNSRVVNANIVANTATNQSTNVAQIAGTTADTNSGNKSAGTQRVVIATDQPALTNKLLVTPDSVALPAHQSTNVDQVNGTTIDTNSGNKSAGTTRVVLATDQPQLTNKLLVTPDANSSVNVGQIGGNSTLTGNGVTGTGSQRVTISSDNTAFNVNPLSATAPIMSMNSASANSGLNSAMAGVFDDTSPTTITENNFGFLRMSSNRNLYGTIRDAAGNERGANVNSSNQLSVSVDNTAAQNQTQIGGTTIDVNSGNKSAGTQRVVLATDQPTMTNAQPVTPQATESYLGFVGGKATIVSANFTRPADTTAYASGDLIANSTTAASVTPMSFTVSRINDASGMIRRAKLKKSTTTTTNATFRIHLYQNDPSASTGITNGDNGAWSTKEAGWLGDFDCDMTSSTSGRAFSDAADCQCAPAVGTDINFIPKSGSQLIYALLEARAAYTPGNGEVFTVYLETLQN